MVPATSIPFELSDVEDNLPVVQLGWIGCSPDSSRCNSWEHWNFARRKFDVVNLESRCSYLFKCRPKYYAKKVSVVYHEETLRVYHSFFT